MHFVKPRGYSSAAEHSTALCKAFTLAGNHQPTGTPRLALGKVHESFQEACVVPVT